LEKYQNKFRIKSNRLTSWDYTTAWWYYVTINTFNHKEYFGEVKNAIIELNEIGKIAEDELLLTPKLREYVELDNYVIMPNHIHAIIIIIESENIVETCRGISDNHGIIMNNGRDVARYISTNGDEQTDNYFSKISPKPKSLSAIIRSYKSAVTKRIRKIGMSNFKWQSSFYDRIIRNETELFNIRKYIEQNPLKWDLEKDIGNIY
jgi:REP element-mobilizing transposase RayT